MAQTAVQLYSLREMAQPLPTVLETVAETSFDGVEFAHRVRDSDIEAVAAAIERTGLDVAGAHVGLDALEDDCEAVLTTYERLGCRRLVVPFLDETHFESSAAVDETARRLSELADTLADHGFSLHYHNHAHEFVDLGDRTAMTALLERTDETLGFELDLGWASAAGVDPVALIERYGDRISLVHVADVDEATQSSVELGDGDLDLESCLAAARAADIDWYVYEHDEPTDPFASLEHGARTLETRRERWST
ncbi:sugar phosphate isomerase/epimerase family protein [Natrialbaceae archaeon A-arb3/5]